MMLGICWDMLPRSDLPGPTRTYMRHLKNSPHNDPKAEAPGAIRDAVYSEAGQEVRKR